MKRREFIKRSAVTLAALGAASLTGCAGSGDSTTGGKLVKVAMCVADTTPAAQALKEVFIPQVEKETEGRYSIQLYPSNVLGGEKVVYDYTKTGIVEMCVVGTGMWSETPKMSSPDFPFMFRDVEHASRCYQGELGDYLKEEVESTQPLQMTFYVISQSLIAVLMMMLVHGSYKMMLQNTAARTAALGIPYALLYSLGILTGVAICVLAVANIFYAVTHPAEISKIVTVSTEDEELLAEAASADDMSDEEYRTMLNDTEKGGNNA